jgi:hypothetical protein
MITTIVHAKAAPIAKRAARSAIGSIGSRATTANHHAAANSAPATASTIR